MGGSHAAVTTHRLAIRMRPQLSRDSHHQRLPVIAVTWLLGGIVLLLTTLVPLRTELLGWTPAFWLVGAPLIVLLGLDPTLPRQLLTRRRRRYPVSRYFVWH
jgi:hypothetical protein